MKRVPNLKLIKIGRMSGLQTIFFKRIYISILHLTANIEIINLLTEISTHFKLGTRFIIRTTHGTCLKYCPDVDNLIFRCCIPDYHAVRSKGIVGILTSDEVHQKILAKPRG